MFAPFLTLSLATSLLVRSGVALDVDVKDQKSIKEVAKTLAGSIVALYKDDLKETLTPGLFDDPYYWWEGGVVFETLIEYSALTGDNQYDDLVGEAMYHQAGDSFDYAPLNQTKSLGNDDQCGWALAAMSAAEHGFPTSKLGNLTWIDLAKNAWESQVMRWDTESCNGGFRWQVFQFNKGYTYKNAMSQGQFMLLSTRLAKYTGNSTYSDWATKVFKWTQDIGLVDDDFHIYDGKTTDNNCNTTDKIEWSIHNGIFAEVAAHMYNLTEGSEEWKTIVNGIIENTSKVFTRKEGGTLFEICEPNGKCNTDQRAYKGITVRSLARAAISAPFVADTITSTLETSAEGAAKQCNGKDDDFLCSLRWDSSSGRDPDDFRGLGEFFSALAVVQGLLVKDAKPLNKASSSEQGTATGNPTGSAPETSGNAKPADHDGAAGALTVSHGLVLASIFMAAALF